MPYVVGDRLHGRAREPQALGSRVDTTLLGTLAPAAVPGPDGRRIAYNTWRGKRPLVRLFDTRSGEGSVLAEGAHSPAWASDGRIAYFQALRPDLEDLAAVNRYLGHVVVQRPGARAERWTRSPGRYVVAAWASGRLLVYRLREGWPDLLALDGPGRVRVLARAGALVAVSPDGARAVIGVYGRTPALVRLLDVAGGREQARLSLVNVRWILESGSWVGDVVAVPASPGIALVRVRGMEISLDRVLRLGARGFPTGVREARLDPSGRRVVAWGELESLPRQALPQAALVECDRVTLRCVRGATSSSAAAPRPLYNPSRPLRRG